MLVNSITNISKILVVNSLAIISTENISLIVSLSVSFLIGVRTILQIIESINKRKKEKNESTN